MSRRKNREENQQEKRQQEDVMESDTREDMLETNTPQEIPQKKELQGEEGRPGRKGPIDEEFIGKLYAEYERYYDGKQVLNQRIKESEEWYKLRHWNQLRKEEDEPTSAYLFNALINKHADAMDNYPEPAILPREESDKQTADMLSKIVPAILEQNNYLKTYSDTWWSKLKAGTSVTGVFWNKNLDNGLGDVDVKEIDILNIYWEPGIRNIQQSKYLFITTLMDNDALMTTYPFLPGPGGELNPEARYSTDDYIDNTNKTTVIDCYYKKRIGGRDVLHYIKFIPNHILYASENDENYAGRGFYDHGKFPVVFDVMFPEKDSPAGFGYIDIMKEPQMYIDKMDGIILRHAVRTGKPRWVVSDAAGMNEEEMQSDSDIVHVSGRVTEEYMREITIGGLDSAVYNRLQGKIEELKETSGNTDYSQGTSTGGVTAASAIAALQEASSKLSRDMIRLSYNAYTEIVLLILEVIRQFYDVPRSFRILGDGGEMSFVTFDNSGMIPQPQPPIAGIDFASRKPIYDIKASAQKASPYSRLSQNELAKELYGAGAFNPEAADQALMMLEMMDFDGKDEIIKKISENARLYRENVMLKETMAKMGIIIDAQNGTNIAQNVLASLGQSGMPSPTRQQAQNLGGSSGDTNGIVERAKEETANRSNPR